MLKWLSMMTMSTLNLTNALIEKKDVFQDSILSWGRCHFRDYPWRHYQQDIYAVLVAELLLKRTTATAAANTYDIFLKKYPTLLKLASATEEELALDLLPVGLYRQRARSISQMTRYLITNENGTIPSSLERLLKIPGLGDYSARAILSFGFGVPVAVVDANVVRVVQRVFGKSMRTNLSHSAVQDLVDYILPEEAHRKFNFGLLDYGALVCRYDTPRCDKCTINRICDYYAASRFNEVSISAPSQLRKLRLEKGLSLAQLAVKAGVSKLTVIKTEKGSTRARKNTLRKLAIALGADFDNLIT
ncbi:Endonuclease III [subsurface metagenome]